MCVSGFSLEKSRYGWSALLFYFFLKFYMGFYGNYVSLCHLSVYCEFMTFASKLAIFSDKMFRVWAKNLGRVWKPETRIYFDLA